MDAILLHNATIVTSSGETTGSIFLSEGKICEIIYSGQDDYELAVRRTAERYGDVETIELAGKHLMAGGIDAHVHFREPGLTHKADIETESMAAVAGGVTSVMDMPNTSPATISAERLMSKLDCVGERSYVNIGFHIGATNGNIEEIRNIINGKTDVPSAKTGGVKVFMGSSTGNMLVDSKDTLDSIFEIKERPVLVHCEDEETIRTNLEKAKEQYGDDIPFKEHMNIRSRKACIRSSIKALEKAISKKTKLVLCHISTKEEMEMVRAAKGNNPDIIAETSCNYLWFCDEDYERLGSKVKCNPSIKTKEDRKALRNALADGIIDIIGSDHAPHLLSEKAGIYTSAPSGLPSIQQTLPVLLTVAAEEDIPLSRIAAVFSENASDLYGLKRGKIQTGYAADIVIFDIEGKTDVTNDDQYSKCVWTPYDGASLEGRIETVFVNGRKVMENGKVMTGNSYGKLLEFNC